MRVGIITQYCNSLNYGGVLQAFALCRVLEQMAHVSEQISFPLLLAPPKRTKLQLLKKLIDPRVVFRQILYRTGNRWFAKKSKERQSRFSTFGNQYIPHTKRIYYDKDVAECTLNYDMFITGSDQVWNPDCYKSAYFLDFVPTGKPKISYAASLGKQMLTAEQLERFRVKLQDFKAVSVREQDAVSLLQPVSPVPVEWVLDPTLLLMREQWDEVCGERLISGNYLFCYFLGHDLHIRKLAREFARRHSLMLVTIPHAGGRFEPYDLFFGKQKFYDASPADFISLIRYADRVFTDSFHACIFSHIYQREYMVFPRQGLSGMSTRIYSLASLFGSEDHFCDTPEKRTLAYMEALRPIDYSRELPKLEEMRVKSKNFLERSLNRKA